MYFVTFWKFLLFCELFVFEEFPVPLNPALVAFAAFAIPSYADDNGCRNRITSSAKCVGTKKLSGEIINHQFIDSNRLSSGQLRV